MSLEALWPYIKVEVNPTDLDVNPTDLDVNPIQTTDHWVLTPSKSQLLGSGWRLWEAIKCATVPIHPSLGLCRLGAPPEPKKDRCGL